MTPETIAHEEMPWSAQEEARKLLAQTRNYTTWAGTGWCVTDSEEIALALNAGWKWDVPDEDEEREVHVLCAMRPQFSYAPGGKKYYELTLPAALVVIARELREHAA